MTTRKCHRSSVPAGGNIWPLQGFVNSLNPNTGNVFQFTYDPFYWMQRTLTRKKKIREQANVASCLQLPESLFLSPTVLINFLNSATKSVVLLIGR